MDVPLLGSPSGSSSLVESPAPINKLIKTIGIVAIPVILIGGALIAVSLFAPVFIPFGASVVTLYAGIGLAGLGTLGGIAFITHFLNRKCLNKEHTSNLDSSFIAPQSLQHSSEVESVAPQSSFLVPDWNKQNSQINLKKVAAQKTQASSSIVAETPSPEERTETPLYSPLSTATQSPIDQTMNQMNSIISFCGDFSGWLNQGIKAEDTFDLIPLFHGQSEIKSIQIFLNEWRQESPNDPSRLQRLFLYITGKRKDLTKKDFREIALSSRINSQGYVPFCQAATRLLLSHFKIIIADSTPIQLSPTQTDISSFDIAEKFDSSTKISLKKTETLAYCEISASFAKAHPSSELLKDNCDFIFSAAQRGVVAVAHSDGSGQGSGPWTREFTKDLVHLALKEISVFQQSDSTELTRALRNAIIEAHNKAILDAEKAKPCTTLCYYLIRTSKTTARCIGIAIGDVDLFHINTQGVAISKTMIIDSKEDPLDISDPGGQVGNSSGLGHIPDIRNMRSFDFTITFGERILTASDGVVDNLSPWCDKPIKEMLQNRDTIPRDTRTGVQLKISALISGKNKPVSKNMHVVLTDAAKENYSVKSPSPQKNPLNPNTNTYLNPKGLFAKPDDLSVCCVFPSLKFFG